MGVFEVVVVAAVVVEVSKVVVAHLFRLCLRASVRGGLSINRLSLRV